MSGEKVLAIHFVLLDSKINRSIACKNTNSFILIEEMLYNEYREHKNNVSIFFLVNEKRLKIFLAIEDNNIKDGDNIVINNIENTNIFLNN